MFLALLTTVTAIAIPTGTDAKVLGWTGDGRYLVWTQVDYAESMPKRYYLQHGDEQVEVEDPDKLPPAERAKLQFDEIGMGPIADESATVALVHDTWRGSDQKFMLSYRAESPQGNRHPTLRPRLAKLPNAAAFDAWKKAHPLTMTASKAGPSGAIAMTAKLAEKPDPSDDPGPPEWHGATLAWRVPMTAQKSQLAVRLSCGTAEVSYDAEQEAGATYTPSWSATPIWAPGGRRAIVIVAEAKTKTMRGDMGGTTSVVLMPCGVRVGIVAPPELDMLAEPLAASLEKAGYSITTIGPAKARRAKTIVYSDDAHRGEATVLAATIPGGASVEKLDWKPNADIVVALGDSAR